MNTRLKNVLCSIGGLLTSMLLLAGCDVMNSNNNGMNSNNTGVRQLRITMTAGGENSSAHNKTSPLNRSNTHRTSTHQVELSAVKLLVDDLELENASNDSLDFEDNNFVINLPLDGDTLELADRQVPAGAYDKLDLEIDSDEVDDPDLNDGSNRYSIVAKGSYNGEEFIFRSKREFEEEFIFDPPIQVADTTSSITLNLSIDVDHWFIHADPTNPDDQATIEYNIKSSLHAYHHYHHHSHDDDQD